LTKNELSWRGRVGEKIEGFPVLRYEVVMMILGLKVAVVMGLREGWMGEGWRVKERKLVERWKEEVWVKTCREVESLKGGSKGMNSLEI
jgi:hypothetical protein